MTSWKGNQRLRQDDGSKRQSLGTQTVALPFSQTSLARQYAQSSFKHKYDGNGQMLHAQVFLRRFFLNTSHVIRGHVDTCRYVM